MTADTDQLSRPDRRRLLERLAELRSLDALMRRPGGLAEAPQPAPLHRTGADNHREDSHDAPGT
jgi:hypothetical protein